MGTIFWLKASSYLHSTFLPQSWERLTMSTLSLMTLTEILGTLGKLHIDVEVVPVMV